MYHYLRSFSGCSFLLIKDKMASTAAKSTPRDAQVMAAILKDMGVVEYEPRLINQMLEFTYRTYLLFFFYCTVNNSLLLELEHDSTFWMMEKNQWWRSGSPYFYCKFCLTQIQSLASRSKPRSLWNRKIQFATETVSVRSHFDHYSIYWRSWGVRTEEKWICV